MAKFVAPVVGATIGFFVGGPMGASVGWMAGSWVGNVVTPAEKTVFDPGIQELPLINQALRGIPIAMIFGTVRVQSDIIWRANLTTTENRTTEKMGGGSGAPKTESTTITYTYKMDMIYHMGFVPVPYDLKECYAGSSLINPNSFFNMGTSDGSEFTGALVDPGLTQTDIVTISSDEVFFYTGGGTSTTHTGWSYFQTSAGAFNTRWPHTVWIGFKQMNLGGAPNVPNLNFVVGPAEPNVNINGGYIAHASSQTISDTEAGMSNLPDITDINGNYWVAAPVAGAVRIYSNRGVLLQSITTAQLQSDADALIGATGECLLSGSLFFGPHVWPLLNGQYMLVAASDLDAPSVAPGTIGNENQVCWLLYEAYNGTARNLVGFCWNRGTLGGDLARLAGYISDVGPVVCATGNYSEGGVVGETGPILVPLRGTQIGSYKRSFQVLPSIANLKAAANGVGIQWGRGSTTSYTWPHPYEISDQTMTWDSVGGFTSDEEMQFFMATNDRSEPMRQSGTSTINNFMVLPYLDTSDPLVVPFWTMRAYVFFNKAAMTAHVAADANTNVWVQSFASTYPNGLMMRAPLGAITELLADCTDTTDPGTTTFLGSSYAFAVDNANWPSFPFSDDQFKVGDDATVDLEAIYDCRPTYIQIRNGIWLIAFWKFGNSTDSNPSLNTDAGASRAYTLSMRLYTYNAYTGVISGGTRYTTTGFLTRDLNGSTDAIGSMDVYHPTVNVNALLEDGKFEVGVRSSFSHSASTGNNFVIFGLGDFESTATDVTPPYIIRQVLANAAVGVGFDDATQIDDVSYLLADAYCRNKGIVVSTQYRRETSYLQIVEELLALYGGYLTIMGNKIKFGVMDPADVPVRVIDNEHFVVKRTNEGNAEPPLSITRGAMQDTVNRVRVNYQDRRLGYRQNQVEMNDEVDQDLRGMRLKEFPPQFVMSEALANQMAERVLWTNMYQRDGYMFQLGPKDSDLEPGDLITLVDSFSGLSTSARIVLWQEKDRLTFNVAAVQWLDYPLSLPTRVNSSTVPSSLGFSVGDYMPVRDFNAYELPREFQADDTLRAHVGWAPLSNVAGARLYMSPDGTTYSITQDQPIRAQGGIMLSSLPNNDTMAEDVVVELYAGSGFITSSNAPLGLNGTLTSFTTADRQQGLSAMWVGSEMLAWEEATLLSQNRYRLEKVYRGWGGTPYAQHNSGDVWWHHFQGGIFSFTFNDDQIGTTFYYKVVPYNFNGVQYNISSVVAKQYTLTGLGKRPQGIDTLHLYVGSGGSRPEEIVLPKGDLSSGNLFYVGFPYQQNVGGDRENITFTWPLAARLSGFGAGGFGTFGVGGSGYGRFSSDTESIAWRVSITGSGNAVVRSVSVGTNYYEYTAAMNSSDNGVFRGNIGVSITPFNAYGNANRSAVLSLELF